MKEAQDVVNRNYAGDLYVMPFKAQVQAMIAPVKRFGFSVMVAGIAILLITIIGLIGYTADEVQRRAKEIAIRKVNGTTVGKILRIFCFDILKVAVPSLLAGAAVAREHVALPARNPNCDRLSGLPQRTEGFPQQPRRLPPHRITHSFLSINYSVMAKEADADWAPAS